MAVVSLDERIWQQLERKRKKNRFESGTQRFRRHNDRDAWAASIKFRSEVRGYARWPCRRGALQRSRRRAVNRKKNPAELSVRFSVHAVASMAIEAAGGECNCAGIGSASVCSPVAPVLPLPVHYQNVTTSAVHATRPDHRTHDDTIHTGPRLLIIRFFLPIHPRRSASPRLACFSPPVALPPLVFPIDTRKAQDTGRFSS